jgi:hypothetical protein
MSFACLSKEVGFYELSDSRGKSICSITVFTKRNGSTSSYSMFIVLWRDFWGNHGLIVSYGSAELHDWASGVPCIGVYPLHCMFREFSAMMLGKKIYWVF